jgi:universal stress protein A
MRLSRRVSGPLMFGSSSRAWHSHVFVDILSGAVTEDRYERRPDRTVLRAMSVALAEGGPMKAIRRILHATDFSTASAPAFANALDWAKRMHAELRLVHVIPLPLVGEGYPSRDAYDGMMTAVKRETEARLTALAVKARKAGVRTSTAVLTGVPHEEIVADARRRHADLVVVGTHGRTGFSRIVMGSVATRVIALARAPVLTVRSS